MALGVLTPIVFEYFSDGEQQDCKEMLFVWFGSISCPSKNYLRAIFEKYRTVSDSVYNYGAAVQGQPTSHFEMSSSPVSRSQALRNQSHPELQSEIPTMFATETLATE